VFYVSAIPPFLSWAVFLTFIIFWSLNSLEWIPNIALCVLKSLLLLFSFKMHLLYLLLKSLLPAIYIGKRAVQIGLRRKDLLYKK
jgi:hypothetical protein